MMHDTIETPSFTPGIEPLKRTRRPTAGAARAVKSVLLVEDHIDFHESLALRLRAEGLKVHSAWDGFGGLCAILEKRPDLVVLDLLLPDLHGLELMRFLRTTPGIQQIPVIVLTGDPDISLEERALALGVRRVLFKPVRQRAILSAIRDVLDPA